jgi:DNA-binding phage protein
MQYRRVIFMGYTKLDYEGYLENIDYWLGAKGMELPLWADRIADKGGRSVCAIDFYDDIFGDDLEEHRLPEDYRSGEYGGIVVERIPTNNNKKKYTGRRVTVTQGNMELYDLIEQSENFCMIAPVSYIGRHRTNKNARYLYALVIEIDDIESKHGIEELFHSWNRKNLTMPKPTYIVCSGSGLHLYFVFERPIPLFQNMFEQLSEVKTHFTTLFWNKYVTNSHTAEKIQYESINQPFRCVGTVTKNGKAYAMAFKIGEKVTIEYFNQFLPKDKQMTAIYKSNLTLTQAKELYPKWYQKRIVEGQSRGHWNRHEGIYYNWIEKMKEGAVVGHRYSCLENLCSLAVQCNIAPEQVEKDCRELAEVLEELTEAEDNHFTQYDILCALKTYHNADEGAYRRRIDYISKKTGIPLTPNKRNGRKQAVHVEYMNMNRKFKVMQNECTNGGRPSKEQLIIEYLQVNQDKSVTEIAKQLGVSRTTVYKYKKILEV